MAWISFPTEIPDMPAPARAAGKAFLCRFLPTEVESGGPLIDNAKVAGDFHRCRQGRRETGSE